MCFKNFDLSATFYRRLLQLVSEIRLGNDTTKSDPDQTNDGSLGIMP